MFLLASCDSAVVEQLTNDPKFEGLNPVATDIGRKKKKNLMFLFASGGSAVVEQLSNNPMFEASYPAITDIG